MNFLNEKLKEFQNQLSIKKKQKEEYNFRIKVIDAEIKILEKTVEQLEDNLKNTKLNISNQNELVFETKSNNPNLIFKEMTIGDAAIQLLKVNPNGLTTREVLDGLLLGGMEFKTKKPYISVFTALIRLADKPNPLVVKKKDKWFIASQVA